MFEVMKFLIIQQKSVVNILCKENIILVRRR
jgi:hypothetical protein